MATEIAESISSNLTFTAKVPLLLKATSNDEKPTQGYDLQEITNISKSSLPNCESLLTFLLRRLEQKSPHIKLKVLNLMKYLVVNGHSEFRSGLRHNAEIVKEMTIFRGEIDPIHGDGLNVNVREAASKLELLLFDVNNPEVEVICQSMIAPNQTGKKMEGFGNSYTPQIKKDTSFSDVLKKVKESVPELMKLTTRKPFETPNGTKQYTPVKLSTGSNDRQGLEDTGDSDEVDHMENGLESGEGGDEINVDNHYYEKKLVDDITAPGGVRTTPSKETLKEFVNKSSSLDFQVILDFLDEKLRNRSTIVQLKSLCVLEYLLRCDLPNIFSSINDHCGYLCTLTSTQDSVLQAKANKISLTISSAMKLQQAEDQPSAPPSYEAAKELPSVGKSEIENQEQTRSESLFSGMNFPSPSSDDAASVATYPVTRQQQAVVPDLLGGIGEETLRETGTGSTLRSGNSVDILDPLITFESSEEKAGNSRHIWDTTELDVNTNGPNTEMRQENNGELNRTRQDGLISGTNQVSTNTIDLLTDLQLSMATAQNPIPHGSLVSNTNVSSMPPTARRPLPKDMKPHEDGFAFLRKSSKKDAFSFVSDEIAASKTKR